MHRSTKYLLYCGALACPLFLTAVFIEGAFRPNYNPMLFPLSSLAIGESGWTQISNFILTGILLIAFSFGLIQACKPDNIKFRGPRLIMWVGVGLLGAGIFVTDPIYGYPTDLPLVLRQYTYHGHLHDGFSMLVFVCLPWACFSFRKYFIQTGNTKWAGYSTMTGFAIIIAFVITSMGFKQLPGFVNYAGLFQRICIGIGWIWMTLLALHFVKQEKNQ